jgi:hypothetical protein
LDKVLERWLKEKENIFSIELVTAIRENKISIILSHQLGMLSKEDQIRLLPRAIEAASLQNEIDYLTQLKRKQ